MSASPAAVIEKQAAPGRIASRRPDAASPPDPSALAILADQLIALTLELGDVRAAEERHALALEAAGEGVWDWDVPSGRVYFSPRWCGMLGYAQDEIVPHVSAWEQLVHPEDWPSILAALEPTLAGTIPTYECEHRVRRKDGTWTWILDRGCVVRRDAEGAPLRMVGTHTDVTARRSAEEALRLSEERYALAARATHHAIWDWEFAHDRVHWSGGVTRLFGYPLSELSDSASWWLERIHPADRERVERSIRVAHHTAEARDEWRETYRFLRHDGTWASVVDRGYVVRDAQGLPVRMIGAMEDVTGQAQLEEGLRRAQKMEAVGQLAGGVAHDFNNLLTAISGNLELAQFDLPASLPASHPVRTHLAEIAVAAERASVLVRQLLAFSRKQPVSPTRLRLGELVRGAESLLRRVIGEEIVLDVATSNTDPLVLADRGQLEQVLVNLAVNARDAMLSPKHGHPGTGGTLTIETGRVTLTMQEAAAWNGLAAGDYASLVVRDTGHGMDPATRERIFEPFFTTKPLGRGTGLGLATTFGIVQQAGGGILVQSEPNAGATFHVLLPAVAGVAVAMPMAPAPAPVREGDTILLVEDEEPVRLALRQLLERRGYRVLAARHGEDALELWAHEGPQVTAVVTDVRMPAMGGPDLVQRLHAERPRLPVVYVSGYADDARALAREPWERFMEKPFSTAELVDTLAEVVHTP